MRPVTQLSCALASSNVSHTLAARQMTYPSDSKPLLSNFLV